MSDRSDDVARRASDDRFRRGREALALELRRLLGAHHAAEPLADADAAAALAVEARAAHRTAEEGGWALVRHEWPVDDREGVTALVHAVGARVGPRPVWLVVPDREPQVVALTADAVLDNPLGFAGLASRFGGTLRGMELVVADREVPAGLWLGRHIDAVGPEGVRHSWELEVWGAEPWLSAATRAVRELGRADPPAG
jgi:hypothetical protein